MVTSEADPRLYVVGSAHTDTGLKRTNNEDAFLFEPTRGLFVVADGMGGHRGGEVASRLATEAISNALHTAPDGDFLTEPTVPHRGKLLDWLKRTVDSINRTIQERAAQDPSLHGMGCTCDAVLLRGRGLFLAHVGDSRVYILRDGKLYRLTDDHTYGQEMLVAGVFSAEESATHEMRNVLTRALGPFPTVHVDSAFIELAKGDVVLLCSDGLYNELPADRLRELLSGDPTQAAAALVEAALEAGGRDNITAVVFAVKECGCHDAPLLGSEPVLAALARSPLFAALTPGELLRVQKLAIGRRFAIGEGVIDQEQPVSSLWLVVAGCLSVFRDGEKIGVNGIGDPAGDPIFVPQASAVSVRADSESILLEFPLAELAALRASEPALAAKLTLAALERVSDRLFTVTDVLIRFRRAGLIPPYQAAMAHAPSAKGDGK